MNMKREKARIRREKSRKKLRDEARAGDPGARKKMHDNKKYDKKYSSQYRQKRKSSTAGSGGVQKVRQKITQRKISKRKT